jgi:hypothetical protein
MHPAPTTLTTITSNATNDTRFITTPTEQMIQFGTDRRKGRVFGM